MRQLHFIPVLGSVLIGTVVTVLFNESNPGYIIAGTSIVVTIIIYYLTIIVCPILGATFSEIYGGDL